MLLPQTKEREYRFKLALRMGLPIFFLVLAFVSETLINNYESIQTSFYFISILLLTFSIYFIFFLIYNGFDVNITENVSKTFTREYLYSYLKKEIKKHQDYTLVLLSIDNLEAINSRYGIKNGDKVLYESAKYFGFYFENKKIINFPMGHIKSGDFIIGLKGKKEEFNTLVELLCLKSSDFKVDDIEVSISGAITDTLYSSNLEYMIENLFELQIQNKHKKLTNEIENINPNDLELYVIDAINNKSVSIATQSVFYKSQEYMKEYFIKLKTSNGKILHPKSYMKVVSKLGLTAEYDYLIFEKSILYSQKESNSLVCLTVSPSSLRDQNFLTKIKTFLYENTFIKNRLVFLMSEADYFPHIEHYNSILQSLRKDGIKIAIDRFGSLHTSFLYLRDLDVDIIRFDTFYTKNSEKEKNKNIMNGLNTVAHLSGVQTWIKMVEDTQTLEFAKEQNIDFIQGKALADIRSQE